MAVRALRIRHVALTVSDLDAMAAFFCDALGFASEGESVRTDPALEELLGGAARQRFLRLGTQRLELIRFEQPGRPYPAGTTGTDLLFQHIAIVTSDMEAAYARLHDHGGATAITEGGPQRLPAASGGATAFKFRDPDGHPLELIQLPGSAWESLPKAATLGYDHSAISVADAEASVAFYTRQLGFRLAARQVNGGPEQERLDAAPGVSVDVVALEAQEATPHLELLGYRHPRGRAMPQDQTPRDIAATRLVIEAEGLGLSPNPARLALRRDPDGHLLQLEA